VTPNTAFAYASISKTFTSALILQLVDEGTLHLTDSAAALLPPLRLRIDPRITVRMLLDHTSGLPDYFLNPKIDRPLQARPRDAWTIDAGARPGGDPPSAYADLGRWLARAISPAPARLEHVEATGREIGRELAPTDALTDPAESMRAALVSLGFAPHQEIAGDGGVTFCLGNCPYRDAVHENQEVVCTLHRGMTRGLLDVVAPGATLDGFVPRDPDTAGCLIELGPARG
jgi:hypothetical protein